MQVAHFPNEYLPPEETEQVEGLRRIIEGAISDGRLSHDEMEQLKSVAFANGKIISAELQLYRNLVLDKIDRGELEYAW